MGCQLAGNASTQSRGRRPLSPGAVSARTLWTNDVHERVEFTFADGHAEQLKLLSWVVGQAGLLWGAGPFPASIEQAIRQPSYSNGVHGSYGHAAEWQLADLLGQVFDGLLTSDDLAVRFFQNGGDACAAAVRIARAFTDSFAIATQGYHGVGDSLAHAPASTGIPGYLVNLHRRFEFGDTAGMKAAMWQTFATATCVMVEVPALDDDAAIAGFLRDCRETCDRNGIPLIFDDVVLGFRLALGGTAEYYGVRPDMVCLGKAMCATGGVSALIGRADLVGRLGEDVFYSTTFGGSPGPCAVAAATVRWLHEHRSEVYGEAGHLRRIGTALKDGYNALGIKCVGQPERSVFAFPSDDEWLSFCSRMIGAGYMVHRPNFPTLAHTLADVEATLEAAGKA